MTFDEVLAQVRELLEREGRVSYRALKRRFSLDDDYLEDLKDELIKAKRLAADEDGAVLVWTGASPITSPQSENQKRETRNEKLEARNQKPTLDMQQPDAKPQVLDSARPEAERRQLTVMFCD